MTIKAFKTLHIKDQDVSLFQRNMQEYTASLEQSISGVVTPSLTFKAISSDYSLPIGSIIEQISVTTGSATINVSLPPASKANGKFVIVYIADDDSGSATASSTDLISGNTTRTITGQFSRMWLVSNGLTWVDMLATSGSTDADAIHDNVSGEINAVASKATPVSADVLLIEDSAASFSKKKVLLSSLPGAGETNTASNVGAGTGKVFKQKTGVDLELKSIAAGSSKLSISNDVSDVTLDVVEANLTITESQISDLSHTTDASLLVSGVLADARVQETNVTQHEGALTITESQISDLTHIDATAIHDNVNSEISAITSKATPTASDFLLIEDAAASNAKKKITIGDITITESQISDLTHTTDASDLSTGVLADARVQETNVTQHEGALTITESQISDLTHTDTTAIHDNVNSEISAITSKATPTSADFLLIEDAAASNAKKKITIGDISITESQISDLTHTDSDAIHDNVNSEISAITAKATPTTSDFLLIEDAAASNAKKRITIGDIPSTTKIATYIDNTGNESVNSTSFVTLTIDDVDGSLEDTGFSNTSGVVTVTDAGNYSIHSQVAYDGTTSNYRLTLEMEIQKNGTTRIASTSGGYIRANGGSNESYIDIQKTVTLAASDTIEIRVLRLSTTSGNGATIPSQVTLQLIKH